MIRSLTLLLVIGLTSIFVITQTVVDTPTYWLMLAETSTLLQSGQADDQIREQIAGLWQNIKTVQLDDGQIITIDNDWLFDNDLDRLSQRVEAVLAVQREILTDTSAPSLAALEDILLDPRFQYPQTPIPTQPIDRPVEQSASQSPLSLSFSQIILAVLGTLVMLSLIRYFARELNIQRYQPVTADPDDDPTTSEDAQARAAASETQRDYRTAIRYHYLSSLLLLNERGIIHYDPSQTNFEHLQQLRDKPQLYDLLQRIVDTFDHVWYGFRNVDENGYLQFRHNIQQLEVMTVA